MTDILSRLAALTQKDHNGLLPCPFTGKAVEIYLSEGKYGVACTTINCPCAMLQYKGKPN